MYQSDGTLIPQKKETLLNKVVRKTKKVIEIVFNGNKVQIPNIDYVNEIESSLSEMERKYIATESAIRDISKKVYYLENRVKDLENILRR